ncbi:DOS [Acanthosepion pharaonis]|uniref:DOS n=1 Tax=Acanthosepion pharaonis TaxID=158019 RepID=A0A812CY05_ACAPH|nr:DOS [Sepia pharaonis]
MVKSPPHQDQPKKLATWKLFQPKWKRRFFVLFKPARSLPGQFVLNYYGDDQCRKRKGYIDLDQCEQIIESLDVGEYKFVLSIKTIHKGRERVYFLATDTEEDMTTWVQNLCHACGMKQEENPPDLPQPPRPPMRSDSVRYPQGNSAVTMQPNKYQSSQKTPVNQPDSPYLFISQCRSGDNRRQSVDSVPEEPAPPPPPAKPNLSGEVINDDHYDHPKSPDMNNSEDDGVYKMLPSRNLTWNNGDVTMYDVPPPARNGFSRDRYSSERSSSEMKDVFYDVPPRKMDSLCYDTPRVRTQSADTKTPVRPQRHISNSEAYQNLPFNSKCYSNTSSSPSSTSSLRGYPQRSISHNWKSSTMERESINLGLCLPPPPVCGSRDDQPSHGYVNAPVVGPNSGSLSPDNPDEIYVPMEGPTSEASSSRTGRTGGEKAYTDMTECVGTNESVYTDMSKPGPCIGKDSLWSTQTQADTYSIFGTEKTKSFKKVPSKTDDCTASQISFNSLRTQPKLPRKKQAPLPDGSSSSEDDGESTGGLKKILQMAPPAPGKTDCGELKYLDLRLDDNADTPSGPPPSCEYREIDFVKTNALRNVTNARVLE